eukprot:COSAG06_NODE_2809_length_6249_cov_3.516585_3_plen_204_part_00
MYSNITRARAGPRGAARTRVAPLAAAGLAMPARATTRRREHARLARLAAQLAPPASSAASSQRRPPVLIQGPMPIEADFFASQLADVTVEHVGNFAFYLGELDDYPVCVCKTAKGMENTAAATAIAVQKYAPLAIINQGTSGGHDPSLHVGDIVLGKRVLNIGNLKTPMRPEGEGSDPFSWIPMDIMASEGSAGEDPSKWTRD